LGTHDKNNQDVKSYRLDEQCYLMSNLIDLSAFNQKFSPEYKNLISIDNGSELIMNKLHGVGLGAFFDLSPAQKALLVPTIRIFKIYPDGKEVEFKFHDYVNPGDLNLIFGDKQRRPNWVGIKKFDWEDLGKQPAQTGVSFKASLDLELNDIADLFQEVKSDGNTVYRIADLISYAPTEFLNEGDSERITNPDFFRVKVIVGWADPPENELIQKPLRDAIRQNQLHLFLNLTTFNIDYKENGQINISINYVAYLDGVMYEPRTDILGYNKKDYSSFEEDEELWERQKENLEKEGKDSIESNPDDNNSTLTSKDIETKLQEIQEEKRQKVRLERSQLYEKFVLDLYDRKKIFYIDIPWDEVKNFEENRENQKKGGPKPNKATDAQINEAKEQLARKFQRNHEDNENFPDYKSVNFATSPKDSNDHRINFVFLGDILDVALDAFYRQETQLTNVMTVPLTREQYKFLIGSFKYEHPTIPGQMVNIPIVDIPVSMNVFLAWWLRHVIDPQRLSLPIKEFFREFLTSVIINSLTLSCLGENYQPGMYEFYFNLFSYPKGGDDALVPGARLKLEEIDYTKLKAGVNKTSSKYTHYFLCGILGTKIKYDPFPSRAKDHSKGLYWIRVGMETGLVKKISFAKTEMKFYKEAAIAGSFARNQGDVLKSEPYNADITLIGNNIFKPGMMLYLDPLSLGFRGSVPRDALRIGGYYKVINVSNTIGLSGFETKIKAVAELTTTNLVDKGEKPSPPKTPSIEEVK